jgi:hypothetical protein
LRSLIRRIVLLSLLISFLPAVQCCGDAAQSGLTVVATHPWIALLANFIGGKNVTVISIREWNSEGTVVQAGKGRTIKSLPFGAPVRALDAGDARDAGLTASPELRCLYTEFPMRGDNMDAMLSDPSVLPFVAQRVLTALSGWDPQGYPYYQRRLAEFQARLFGAVLSGQQVLRGVPVYDLSGASGALLKASGCSVRSPTPEQLAEWSKGRYAGLKEVLASNWEDGVVTVMDGVTPRALLKFISGRPGTFRFGRPAPGQDYTAFLHDQYIALWQMVSAQQKTLNNKTKK